MNRIERTRGVQNRNRLDKSDISPPEFGIPQNPRYVPHLCPRSLVVPVKSGPSPLRRVGYYRSKAGSHVVSTGT